MGTRTHFVSPEVTVALQGTLDTFALPDVLRLLAATKKSGRLDISGSRGGGSVWVADGDVTAIAVEHAPLAVDAVDALFELLRFEDGSFTFDAEAAANGEGRDDVESLLEGAEALLAEWREIEAVVPSLASWVTMRPELPGADVTVEQRHWTTLVAVGSGATVAAVGSTMDLAELPVSRAVRDLVELGLVQVEVRAAAPLNPPEPVSVADAPEATAAPAEADAPTEADVPTEAVTPAGADAPAEGEAPAADAAPDDAPFPGPRARRARPKRLAAHGAADDVFVPLDLSALHQPGSYDGPEEGEQVEATEADLAAAFPGLAGHGASAPADAAPDADDEEMARQLANLSPRAAEAVRAAAAAATDDEREAALAEAADAQEEPLNRGLLLKFLSSVKS
jgi:hypothetical protein